MLFAILGWIVVMAVGLWLTVAGAFMTWFSYAMGGRIEKALLVFFVVGIAVLGFGLHHAPFTITIGGR